MACDHHAFYAFSATCGSCRHFFWLEAPRGFKQARTCTFQTHACGYNSVDARAHGPVICFIAGHADDLLASLGVENEYRRVCVADNEVLASGRQWRDGCWAWLGLTRGGSLNGVDKSVCEGCRAGHARLGA